MKKLIVICFLAICQLAVAGGGSVVSNHIPKTVYGFIENKGQIYNQDFTPNSEVKYLLNSEGLNVQLKKNSFSYDTYVLENGVLQFHRIDVVLIGANTNPEIIPQNIGRDYLNYYNAVGGVTKVNHFSKVMYKDIYNGIDLEFIASYNKSTPFKYNFIVHKGADVAQIKIEYKGTLKTKLNDGKIELTLSNGLLSESIPKSFLEETKEAVNVEYLLTNNAKEKIVSFITSNFDKTKTLIIDPSPSIIWSTYYGGALEDYGQDVVALDSGNLLITGYTTSTNAIATSGAYQTKSGLNTDAFIVKLNGKGIRQWATYYGGSNEDKGFAIAKDDSDNIVITGRTSSTNAVATLGAHQIKLGGSYDAFIAKFNTTGQLKWGTYYGGADTDIGADAIADDSGNVYATGVSKSTNSIATKGAHQDTVGGKEDAYLVKFNGNGIRQWATYNGGEAYDEGESISKDKFGNIYISGKTASTKNISTSWVYQTALAGYYDVFLSKFDKSGIRIWGTYYGGKLADYGLANTTDDSGNIYVTGQTLSTTKMATKGIYQDSLAGGRDAFLVKFNTKGNIVWGTYYGGKDDDLGHNIISYKNNLYIIGWTNSSTGISTNGSYQNTIGGNTDAFLLGFNDEGKRQWGSYLGGKGNDFAYGISKDTFGSIYLAGYSDSNSIGISTINSHQYKRGGGLYDAFITKFFDCSYLPKAKISISKSVLCNGDSVTLTASYSNNILWNTGSTNPSIIVKTDGIYSFKLDTNGCSDSASKVIAFNTTNLIKQSPNTDTVTQHSNAKFIVIPIDSGNTYQWQQNAGSGFVNLSNVGVYSGVKSDTLKITNTPITINKFLYRCILTSKAGCHDTSKAATLLVKINSGFKANPLSASIYLFPNPAENEINILGCSPSLITITNVLGETVSSPKWQNKISVSALRKGIYFIHIFDENGIEIKIEKLIKR